MTRKAWVIVFVIILVLIILIERQACATVLEDRKKIVIFLDGTPVWVQHLVVMLSGSSVVHTLSLINALAIELPVGSLDAALAFLLHQTLVVGVFDDLVGAVIPVMPLPPEEAPAEESYDWGLEHIGVVVVHQESPTLTGAGVTVAILDTGVNLDHPDLQQNVVGGFNARPGGGSYDDDNGHGTHMAGIIAAAANGQGIIGIAPQAGIAAVKVLDADGRGYLSDLIRGLQWVYVKKIRLVNMSLGFSQDSVPLQRAIERLYEHGVLMVASAGNRAVSSATAGDGGGADEGGGEEGEETASACAEPPAQDEGGGEEGEETATACDAAQTAVKYPARYASVLAVAATDDNDHVTDYSLAGLEVDVAAPGGAQASIRILSTYRGGGYGYGSGTSQAAAHVTGSLALMLQQRPQLSLQEVRALLERTARDLGEPETRQGVGLIAVEHMVATP